MTRIGGWDCERKIPPGPSEITTACHCSFSPRAHAGSGCASDPAWGGAKRGISGSCFVPLRLFQTRVIVLATIRTRERDRPGRSLPAFAAADDRRTSIREVDVHLEDHHRRAERSFEFRVASADDVVHAVAEHHADRVVALLEQRGDVVRRVETGLFVIRPAWIDNVFADGFAIQMKLI